MPPTTEESSAPSGSGGASTEANYQLPWTAIPRFIPGTTDVTEYAKKLQFLAAMWPKESIALLAPRAALLCEGTAFKKVSSLPADKLKSSDDSGVKLLVTTLGGAWGRSEVELKYDVFEKAIFGTIQKSDESNDSYLARHDVHFEELLAQGVSFEEIRAYILLRQSALSAEDRKKIVVEMSGALKYDKVRSAIRLLGSRFFSDLQGQRGAFRSKTYDANMVEDAGNEDAERAYNVNATQGAGDDNDYELDPEYVEALAATDDQDALVVASFEEELEGFFQDTPEMQEALVSYLEARSRLLSKRKVRGFWPVSGHKGFKGSGKGGKGKGKGKSGRDQLLARIAKSTCRACGERGHWKAECPKYGKPGSMSASSKTEAATTVAEVDQGPAAAFLAGHFDESQDLEVLTQLPEEAVSLAEACIVTRSGPEVGPSHGLKTYPADLQPHPVLQLSLHRARSHPKMAQSKATPGVPTPLAETGLSLGTRFARLTESGPRFTPAEARTAPMSELGQVTVTFGKHAKGRTFEDVIVNEESWIKWVCDHLSSSDKSEHQVLLIYIERYVAEAEALETELRQTTEATAVQPTPKSKVSPRKPSRVQELPVEDHWDMVAEAELQTAMESQVQDLNSRMNQMEGMMHQMLSAIQQLSMSQSSASSK
ncbi:hypothetical protein AK812_SmicGene5836 [Symbiodinium microadriaticum]|uniref:CCHC-type domain-containing protein n=1 Tax=Symbiodinium microadriaticum TaxID=2951 RepID=A0A1Q9ESM4_SYMMI|nr:hypothetical protein AK812_SmicGene5836 [Symbiodinium microadriaticum]